MANQFADTDKPSSKWSSRKPHFNLRFPAAGATMFDMTPLPIGDGVCPQTPHPAFAMIPPRRTADPFQLSSNPFAVGTDHTQLPPWAVKPGAPDLDRPHLAEDQSPSPPRQNYAERRARELGIPKYTPEIPPGSGFPPSVLKDIYGGTDERMQDTPLQQQMKFDIERGATQKFNVATMFNYASMQRDRDREKSEGKKNTPCMRREREVAGVAEWRDPEEPNGCIHGMCNMPRGEHSMNCVGVGRKGVNCSEREHAVGNCNEREDNRRQKMKGVGLDPDAADPYALPASAHAREASNVFADAVGKETESNPSGSLWGLEDLCGLEEMEMDKSEMGMDMDMEIDG